MLDARRTRPPRQAQARRSSPAASSSASRVARALINQPQVLLLDEPLGALDLKLRRQMQIELKRIQTEVGLTFVHVTHDQEEAMTMADTIAVMNAGRIEQLGSPGRPLREPAHHLRGQLPRPVQPGRRHRRSGKDGDVIIVDAHGSGSPCRPRAAAPTSGAVILGVRPEKVHARPARRRRSPAGHNVPDRRRRQRRLLHRRLHAVPGQDAVGRGDCAVFEQNTGREILRPGTEVAAALGPEPDLRPRRRPGHRGGRRDRRRGARA